MNSTQFAFLDHPGRSGPFGALMDEYARAADDLCRVAETFTQAEFTREVADDDPNCRTVQAICHHACAAAIGDSNMILKARGMETEKDGPAHFTPATSAGLRALLTQRLKATERALEGIYDFTYEQCRTLEFQIPCGPKLGPETMLEHAIVHLLRHRRQLERWKR